MRAIRSLTVITQSFGQIDHTILRFEHVISTTLTNKLHHFDHTALRNDHHNAHIVQHVSHNHAIQPTAWIIQTPFGYQHFLNPTYS